MLQGIGRVRHRLHFETLLRQRLRHPLADEELVLDKQDVDRLALTLVRSGSMTVPSPAFSWQSVEVTQIARQNMFKLMKIVVNYAFAGVINASLTRHGQPVASVAYAAPLNLLNQEAGAG